MNTNDVKVVDNNLLQKEIKKIDENILIIDTQIRDITTKLNEIQNFSSLFQKKNNLYSNENNFELKMQIALLTNEKEHITNMKKIVITNLFNELYELSNNIILLISSFLNLEFSENINSSEILKKLVRIKQITTIKITDIYESVSAITKNLTIIYDTLNIFNDYIENMGTNIKTNNYHCTNIYTSLKHKYSFILLEYTKFYDTLNNIIPFYINLSMKIKQQLSSKYVLFSCLNNNTINDDINIKISVNEDINNTISNNDIENNTIANNNIKSDRISKIKDNIEPIDIDILNIFNNDNKKNKLIKDTNKSPSIVSFNLSDSDESDTNVNKPHFTSSSNNLSGILKNNSTDKINNIINETTSNSDKTTSNSDKITNNSNKTTGKIVNKRDTDKKKNNEKKKTFRSVVNKVINNNQTK
jgi:hypothetical protein